MKKLLFILLVFTGCVSAQQHSCCIMSVNDENNLLAMNESFAGSHYDPVPFKLEGGKGREVTFKTTDGKAGHAYRVKAAEKTNNVLFVFHEWWGLNDYIKREAERLQAELGNVDVYAIDLYDGKVATVVPDARKYMSEMKEERCHAIIEGAIAFVGSNARIASIGWCLGGAWSLQSALLEGRQAIGCVMYYGMPESDLTKLKTLNCDVLGIFGTQDGFITPQVVETFEENMKEAGKKLTVRSYDAVHAFANPSNPKYNKEHAEAAHIKAMMYLKEKF